MVDGRRFLLTLGAGSAADYITAWWNAMPFVRLFGIGPPSRIRVARDGADDL